jgi:hypothetical protein
MKFLELPFILFDEIIETDFFKYGRLIGIPSLAIVVTILSILILLWSPLLVIAFFLENDF